MSPPLRLAPRHPEQVRSGVQRVDVLGLPAHRDADGLDVLQKRRNQLPVLGAERAVLLQPLEGVSQLVVVVMDPVWDHAVCVRLDI